MPENQDRTIWERKAEINEDREEISSQSKRKRPEFMVLMRLCVGVGPY